MSFETKLRHQEQQLEEAAVGLFTYAHTKGSDNPDGLEGQMMPLFHIIDGNWKGHVVGAQLGGRLEKDMVADFIRQYCGLAGAVLVMFASEVWLRVVKPEEADPLTTGAADHPDREEGMMVTFESVLGRRTIIYPIIRDEAGVRLGTRDDKGVATEGRFTDLVKRIDA